MGKRTIIFAAMLAVLWCNDVVIAQKVEHCVFQIKPAIGSKGGSLTGFTFKYKGETGIVTCLHGVLPGSYYTASGEQKSFVKLSIKYVDIDHDLAFLSSDIINQEKEALTGAKSMPVANRPMKVLGYPAGMSALNIKRVTMGEPSVIKKFGEVIPVQEVSFFAKRQSPRLDSSVLYIEGQMIQGHSGAPLVDDQNLVYGVVFSGVHGGAAGITWAIPITTITWTSISSQGIADRVRALPHPKEKDMQLYDFIFEEKEPEPEPTIDPTALSGTWGLTMSDCYILSADDTPKNGHLKIKGMLTLNFQQDNVIIGKFSSVTSNCGTGDVFGKLQGNNVELTITCTKGTCFNGSFIIVGTLNGKAIRGKSRALPDRPANCNLYISDKVTVEKQ